MRTLSLEEAVSLVPDGARLMVGGFMGVGTPERLIDELVRQRKRDLTIIANDTAVPGPVYLRLLIQIKRAQKFEHMTFRGIERCKGEVE